MQLYKHQIEALNACKQVMKRTDVVYLAGEVRTGKTLVALHLAASLGLPTLFITKKMAIRSIENQAKQAMQNKQLHLKLLTVTNFEQVHKIQPGRWFVIIDEAHSLGAYPKPAKRARAIRALTINNPVLLLSGTPSPESFSQLYNQFWAANKGPWAQYRNFYRWAKDYVNVQKKYFSGVAVNDYSNANSERIRLELAPYMVSITQEEAGFLGRVFDRIHTVPINPGTLEAIRAVVNIGVYKPLGLIALAAAQRMAYVHQLCSGTVIATDEPGVQTRLYVDYSKVDYIRRNWGKLKKAIFYCYVAEGELLRDWFPNNTDSPEKFAANPLLDFICQIKAGQEGTDLSSADVIIFYNISYSASSYFQGRARGQKRDSPDKEVHWLFSDYGLEKEIYNLITGDNGKKTFTLAHYRGFVQKVGDYKTSIRRLSGN